MIILRVRKTRLDVAVVQ